MQDYRKLLEDTFDNLEEIGSGGGGTVFKAYHKRLEKEVVLKKIHSNLVNAVDRQLERDILKSLKHPYIPQVYDFFDSGDEVYTVMEFIPGKSFAAYLKEGRRFSQKDVVRWAGQLCEVVHYLHSQKPPIIHCDIKPANIMLTPEGNICLIDFNISRSKSAEGLATIGYSDGYAPIEQFAVVSRQMIERYHKSAVELADTVIGKSADTVVMEMEATELDVSVGGTRSLMKAISDEDWQKACHMADSLGEAAFVDERTDIYSVGASLYAILTGMKPRPFYQPYLSVEKAGKKVSESFAYVINKAMALKPEDRFQNSGALLNAVRNMEKYDRRYKALVRRQTFAAVSMAILTAASVLCIFAGKQQIKKERQEAYSAYVEKMQEERADKDYEEVEEIYEKAIQIMPDGQDAYYEMGMAYFEQKDYEKCLSFLTDSVLSNPQLVENASYGRFYYINGSCYFELEDYPSAIFNYEKAVELQPEEVSYYRDYVVSLAREGKVEKAEEILEQAQEKKVSADVLSLLQGEIALAKGNYEEAEQGFWDCIHQTEDSYHLLRAYTKLDDVYQEEFDDAEEYEKRAALLSEARDALPEEDRITLTERLAQVYIDYAVLSEKNGDTEKMRQYDDMAIALFKEDEEKGYATFTSRYNIAVLYRKNEDYDAAKAQIVSMLDEYPDNYELYKSLCFIALETEDLKDIQERNYEEFQSLYHTAVELYQENAVGEDSEMLLLEQLYQDLVTNGWLS